jgi:hypothetical protein
MSLLTTMLLPEIRWIRSGRSSGDPAGAGQQADSGNRTRRLGFCRELGPSGEGRLKGAPAEPGAARMCRRRLQSAPALVRMASVSEIERSPTMRHAGLVGILTALSALGLAMPSLAAPERLKGQRFIDVMSDNTLSGTTASGAAFNMYFLDGGDVTYEDSSGEHDQGRWLMDSDGDVCITWRARNPEYQNCYTVTVDRNQITWAGKGGSGEGLLRGGVGTSFLKHR